MSLWKLKISLLIFQGLNYNAKTLLIYPITEHVTPPYEGLEFELEKGEDQLRMSTIDF